MCERERGEERHDTISEHGYTKPLQLPVVTCSGREEGGCACERGEVRVEYSGRGRET